MSLRGAPAPAPTAVPRPSTPQGGSRRFVHTQQLVTNTAGAGAYSLNTAKFILENPSARLQVKVAVTYAPYDRESTALPVGWTFSLEAWDRLDGDHGGRATQSNPIETAVAVPTSYEAGTMNDQWRGAVVVPATGSGSGLAVAGILYVTAAWEPAPGDHITDADLARLFQACGLRVTQSIAVTQLGG